MKDDYPLKGQTTQVQIELEKDVAETIKKMSEYTKYKDSEIINTAIKRFIAVHSDFLPKKQK